VHAADAPQRTHSAFDAGEHAAEVGGLVAGELAEVDVLPREQQHDAR
jgi:hypothetical protein